MWAQMFEQQALWFSVPALVGTAFFVVRLVMLVAGLGHDAGDLGHHDSSHDFQIFSIQSVLAFAMGFGWGGLGGMIGLDWPFAKSLLPAVAAGCGMVWLLAVMLRLIGDLSESGNIQLADAVGKDAEVYLSVPGDGVGRGQVRVTIHERLRILSARSQGEDLPTGTRVRVVGVNADNTVTIARA